MITIGYLKQIAEKNGWKLNPNLDIIKKLLEKMNKNYSQFGNYYCPCKLQRIDENICPCTDSEKEINTTGHCHCMLFFKV